MALYSSRRFSRLSPRHGDRRLYRLGIKVDYGGMDDSAGNTSFKGLYFKSNRAWKINSMNHYQIKAKTLRIQISGMTPLQ